MSDHSADHILSDRRQAVPRVPFDVLITLVILVLCVLYALVFSRMIVDSLIEQVIAPHPNPPRYITRPHVHHPIEWFLIVFPGLLGWLGTVASLTYLRRRWLNKR